MRNLGNAAVAKAVLRGLLRFAKSSKDVPITLRTSDLYAVAPVLRGVNVSLQDRNAVEQITRQAFRLGAELEGHAAEAAVNRALDALRLLNTTYSTLIEEMRSTRADRADRSGVAFRIGDVFIHRKFGYRGVIYGWDRHCQRDEAWVQQMNADPQLPHYYVLPDETDCQRLFGGVRLTKYVGQDNMLHVEGQTVVHRALDCYFSGYSQEQGRYIPLEKLKYEYPDDYSVGPEALRPAGEDANLLLHPELESGNARGKLSGKDATGEKQHAASLRAQSP